jgi:alkylated DNA repair dioxygenase AlkB
MTDEFQQLNLMETSREDVVSLDVPDLDAFMVEGFYSREQGDVILNSLLTDIPWRRDKIVLYGKEMDVPRLTAWHGDPGAVYTYSNIRMEPEPWSPLLESMRDRVSEFCNTPFNSVLLNLYRDGNDSMGWHSDDEKELGVQPTIASLSFGAERVFKFRHKSNRLLKRSMNLSHGSLLVMKGGTQVLWQHSLPKTKKEIFPRINLTFRMIFS